MLNIKFEKIFTISNFISSIRLILIFPTIYLLKGIGEHDSYRIYILLIFALAYLSDLLDGYLARKFNEISELGKIIDPLADKIFVIAVVIQLFLYDEITSFYFWVIILRDVVIFLGGIYVSKTIGRILPSNLLGKMTVASIGLFLIAVVAGLETIPLLYNFIQYLSILLSFASVLGYGLRAYETIKWHKKNGISKEY
ncbi:MAG: CDP-alcohol phosphatidyltransferase family protein [Bacteroidota bacterium]